MPDTRTVRERATELFEEYPGTPWEECVYAAAQKLGVMDALIGCQGRVVYTEEDVDAAAKVLVRTGHQGVAPEIADLWEKTSDYVRDFWRKRVIEIITAAGGVVADEGPLRLQEYPEPQTVLVDGGLIELGTGDILYIVRAKEE